MCHIVCGVYVCVFGICVKKYTKDNAASFIRLD